MKLTNSALFLYSIVSTLLVNCIQSKRMSGVGLEKESLFINHTACFLPVGLCECQRCVELRLPSQLIKAPCPPSTSHVRNITHNKTPPVSQSLPDKKNKHLAWPCCSKHHSSSTLPVAALTHKYCTVTRMEHNLNLNHNLNEKTEHHNLTCDA